VLYENLSGFFIVSSKYIIIILYYWLHGLLHYYIWPYKRKKWQHKIVISDQFSTTFQHQKKLSIFSISASPTHFFLASFTCTFTYYITYDWWKILHDFQPKYVSFTSDCFFVHFCIVIHWRMKRKSKESNIKLNILVQTTVVQVSVYFSMHIIHQGESYCYIDFFCVTLFLFFVSNKTKN